MRDDTMTYPDEKAAGFGKSFLRVLAAHVAVILAAGFAGKAFFKHPEPEPIVWLDGGGEPGSAAAPEQAPATPEAAPPPEPIVPLPPLPKEELLPPKETPELPVEVKPKPTPTPTPKPKPTPAPTPRPKPAPTPTPKQRTPAPAAKTSAKASPTPKKKTTPAVAKTDTKKPAAKSPAKSATPKITDSAAASAGSGSAKTQRTSGTGDATNPGNKGGPGAPGGSDAALAGYFKKVEAQFQQEWQQPLTVVRTGHDVEAYVHLRAAADGTVESLTLYKPTGNREVDDSIKAALLRVHKVDRPPAALLKNGVLDESVAFVLEL